MLGSVGRQTKAPLRALLCLYGSSERAIIVCADCDGEEASPCNELSWCQEGKQQAGTGV